jgi:23S rRNA (cytidine2498-2'-O)-methyltransferase
VPGREEELEDELTHAGAKVQHRFERLLVTEDGPKRAAWAANVWLEAEFIACRSIADAGKALASRGREWSSYSVAHHRRAALIAASLPTAARTPFHFGSPLPSEPLGAFTLLEPERLLASPRCSSPFPNGELEFVEDKTPPSRAYLKLWEFFTVTGRKPARGESCLDLGSSPGGWTWVLAKLGAKVTSIDKAPLDPKIARMKGVRVQQASAFALDPASHPPVDWLFSDVICYPSRLLEHAQRWIDAGKVKNVVCTLKFQGSTDHGVVREFARIKGSRLMHLHHNKHELTWCVFDLPAS